MKNQIIIKTTFRQFILFAAICCFLNVITTIGIHGLFSHGATNFEESLLLYKSNIYLANRWWVIVHCLLVIVSMWGVFLIQYKKSPGAAGLGFLFFAVFAITEIFRQFLALFYLNGLRKNYLAATDEALKTLIKFNIENFGLISVSMFGLFILTFGLGNLFYGISMLRAKGFSKILGYLLIIWFVGTFLALMNEFWRIASLGSFIGWYSLIYQPLMRLLLAIWLWKHFKEIRGTKSLE